jgi:Flp pilus assembly protein TadB
LSAPAAAAGVSGDDDQASFQKIVQASSIPGFKFKNFIAMASENRVDQFFEDAGIRGQQKYDLIAIRDRARAAQQGKNKSLVYLIPVSVLATCLIDSLILFLFLCFLFLFCLFPAFIFLIFLVFSSLPCDFIY